MRSVLQRGAVLFLQRMCVWINTKYKMNYYELCRIKQNEYEVRWINSDLYEFIWYYAERRVATGGSLAFTAWVCELIQNITWINMNYLESVKNEIELSWINYDLHENIWYYAERRVATGGSLAFTACVCVWINTKYNMN